jgi:hypothetical protein
LVGYVSGYRPRLVPNQQRLPQIPLQNRRGSELVAVWRFAPQIMKQGPYSWTGVLGDRRCAGDPQRRLIRQSNASKDSCPPGALRRSPGYTAGHSQDSSWPTLTGCLAVRSSHGFGGWRVGLGRDLPDHDRDMSWVSS